MMKRKIQRATSMGCHVAVILAIGGCQIQPAGTPCDDGLCPEGKICVTPSEPVLLGTQKRCVAPGICGNGFREEDNGEECDDGEKNNDHGHCSTECRLNPCGNGQIDRGEQCDNGANN